MTIVAAVLIGIFVLAAALNWMSVAAHLFTGRASSFLPVLGGFLGSAGFLLVPAFRRWAWLPPLLNPSTPFTVVGLGLVARDLWRTSAVNLRHTFESKNGDESARLKLYRRGILIYEWRVERPAGEAGMIGMSRTGTWAEEGDRLHLDLGDGGIDMERRGSGSAMLLRRVADAPPGAEFPDHWSHDLGYIPTYGADRRARGADR